MSIDRTVQIIQLAYPRLYLACHTRHQRKRSSSTRLSSRDSSILAHLGPEQPTTPARLATHLNISRSTLSEAVKRLTALGYTSQAVRAPSGGRRGGIGILLTPKGLDAIRDTSVLESARLREVLGQLTTSDLKTVEKAMSALASACERRAEAMHREEN